MRHIVDAQFRVKKAGSRPTGSKPSGTAGTTN